MNVIIPILTAAIAAIICVRYYTQKTAKLTAELTAELEATKSQRKEWRKLAAVGIPDLAKHDVDLNLKPEHEGKCRCVLCSGMVFED